jgi:hypothetical protein
VLHGGGSVRCSGTIKLVMGEVNEITDDSGHYRHVYRFMKYLKQNGKVAGDAKVRVLGFKDPTSAASSDHWFQVKWFLAEYEKKYTDVLPIWS